jgi:hypothetical protein
MNQWILVLSYLVTPSPSDEVNCAPLPDNFKTEGQGCISMAVPESPITELPSELVLNVYRGPTAKKDCVDQSVRFADNKEALPPEVTLMIAGSKAVAYICRRYAE